MLCTDSQPVSEVINQVWPKIEATIQACLNSATADYYLYLCRMDLLLLSHRIKSLSAEQASSLFPRLIELEKQLALPISLKEIAHSLESINLALD
jgi:hypothetical protein